MSAQDEFLKEGIEGDIDDMNTIIDQFIDYIRHDSKDKAELDDLNVLINEVVQAENIIGREISFEAGEIPFTGYSLSIISISSPIFTG